jgi:zinc protease
MLRQAVFSGSGYGLDSLGSPESLTALDRTALSAHHSRHFNAANISLTIAGDFEPAAALALITEKFAALPQGQRWVAPVSLLASGKDLTIHLAKKQAVLTLGFPGATVSGSDRHALAMIQEYASDMAGPLFTRIREELGLAYQVGASQFLGYDAGLFTFYVATSPEQVDLARHELLAEIAKIAGAGIPDEAFERVRATVLSGLAIQQQSPSSIARHVALDLLFGHPADEYRRLAATYSALSAEQVRQVAARIFSVTPTVVTVEPATETA